MRIFSLIWEIWSSICFGEIKAIILRKYFSNTVFQSFLPWIIQKIILPKKTEYIWIKTVLPILGFFWDYYSVLKSKTFIWRESVFIISEIKLLRLKDFVTSVIHRNYCAHLQKKSFKGLLNQSIEIDIP